MNESQKNDNRALVMSEVMTPEKANFAGNVHGGYILKLLDQVAYACASRYARSYVVTLSVNQVLFKKPVHVGELVTFLAMVNFVGRTSMEVGIKVTSENLQTGETRHTNTCYYTMVATDENLKPIEVPKLAIRTPLEKRRFEEGKWRKEMNIKFAREHAARKQQLREELE